MFDLMCQIEKYAKVEDEMKPSEPKDVKSPKFNEGKNKRRGVGVADNKRSVFDAINTVLKEPIYRILPQIYDKPYFRWPKRLPNFPEKADHKDYYSFHRDNEYQTGQCRSLRFHLKDLVKDRHLKEFIDKAKTKNMEQ